MSRIGKQPVTVPSGVTVTPGAGVVTVTGPRGKLEMRSSPSVEMETGDGKVVLRSVKSGRQAEADYGTARAVLQNMVTGVTKGWKRTLEMTGVGFGAKLNGGALVLSCGFSHDVTMPIPADVKATITKNTIELESSDKQSVGTFAAAVRKVQPPEPYLGKGIRFSEEKVRRKAGKTGKK